jgi:hypothetical protein
MVAGELGIAAAGSLNRIFTTESTEDTKEEVIPL